ncbi:MAG: acyl-CoA dehydrogenase [Deltaproteobacteria bacterium]|nr:MAG: acyl-CoA dehydrogenase [Deltaproteobacteria bacterium]
MLYKQEHHIFREAFKRFVAEHITPNVDAWEEAGEVSRDAWLAMGEYGFLLPWLPEKYGGYAADFLYSVIIMDEICHAGAVGFFAPLHSEIVAPYIMTYGSEEQKAEWLPKAASGECILAVAMSEPNAGSDLASLKCRAELDGDEWVLNGTKTFISNGGTADLTIVAAKTERGVKDSSAISLFLVPSTAPGYRVGSSFSKMGLHSQDTAEIILDECRIPAKMILGERGKGFKYLMNKLQQERIVLTIQAQAMSEKMLEMTVKYAQERKAFGQSVASMQHNAFKIAKMATEINIGRAYLDSLVFRHMKGDNIVTEVSMAKSWVAEMANRVAYDCVQLHGGYGYMEEYPICRFARDIRIFSIFGGTTEVMNLIIARSMGVI